MKNLTYSKSIKKLSSAYKNFSKALKKPYKKISDFEEAILLKMVQISEQVEAIFKGRNISEDKGVEILKRYSQIYKLENIYPMKDITTLLDETISKIEVILKQEEIKLPFPLFSQASRENNGNQSTQKNTVTQRDKFHILIKTLNEMNINMDNMVIYEEDGENTEKNIPYKIIQILEKNIKKTIIISNDTKKATFIYDGIIDIKLLKEIEKGDDIDEIDCQRIQYSQNYKSDLKASIERKNSTESSQKIIHIPHSSITVSSLREIMRWRLYLEEELEALKSAGIVLEGNKWSLYKAEGCHNWPRVGGKNLRSFPSSSFNKKLNIGNNVGKIENIEALEQVFIALGYEIQSLEEIKKIWRREISEHKKQLSKKHIQLGEDGKWYFLSDSIQGEWPYIGTNKLHSYPSRRFNKESDIGNKHGKIGNIEDVKKLFRILGLSLANEEDYKNLRRSQIIKEREKLKEVGIIQSESGKWFFDIGQGYNCWPDIGNKNLKYFPSAGYIKENKINQKGEIWNLSELSLLFESLGFEVISSNQEKKELWKEILHKNSDELKKAGIIFIKESNSWSFITAKGQTHWPEFYGSKIRNLCSDLCKDNNIGNNKGEISNIQHLKDFFLFLGFSLATEQENIRFWKTTIEEKEDCFKEIGITKEGGKWVFGKIPKGAIWPEILGKKLSSFPGRSYNRKNGIGNPNGDIKNLVHIRKLFIHLGFEVSK